MSGSVSPENVAERDPRGKPLWFMLPLIFALEAISTWAGACYRDHDWAFMLHPYLWAFAGPMLVLSAWLFIRRRLAVRQHLLDEGAE